MNKDEKHQRLVKKAIRGNAEAYGQLILEYQAYLYKMAFLSMKNQEDALDERGGGTRGRYYMAGWRVPG